MAPEFYAVGISKGWVEIRSSLTPPKPRKSSVEKEIEEKVAGRMEFYITPDGHYRNRRLPGFTRKRRLNIQAYTFTGGNVVRVYTFSKFNIKTHLCVGLGMVVKLDPELVAKLRLKS